MGRASAARDVRRLLDAGLRLAYGDSEEGRVSEQAFLEVERLAVKLSRRHGQLRFLGMLAATVQGGVGGWRG